jgi:heme/copper-type cytochrome/quinol oxidase subunit 4
MAQETTGITDINQDKVTAMEKQVLGFITMPILAAAPYIVLITSHEQAKSKKVTTMSEKSYNAQ